MKVYFNFSVFHGGAICANYGRTSVNLLLINRDFVLFRVLISLCTKNKGAVGSRVQLDYGFIAVY